MYNTIKFTLYMYGIYYRNKNSICNLLYILKSPQCRLIQYIYYSIFCNISGSIYLTISLAVERYVTVCHISGSIYLAISLAVERYVTVCHVSGSIYLTISLAVERYITVCHPFFKLTHNWPARKEGISGFYQKILLPTLS